MRLLIAALLVVIFQLQSAAANPVRPVFSYPVAHPIAQQANVVRTSPLAGIVNPRSPLSATVLVNMALRQGRFRLPYHPVSYAFPYTLTCSPTPCRLPNVLASEGGQPVNEDPIATDLANPAHLLTGGNDYNCPSLQGFFTSSDGGSTWVHTCMNTEAGTGGLGDPGVAYNTAGKAFITGIDQTGSSSTVIAFETSTNNGSTWSSPATAVTGISPYTFVDKEWLQIDLSATSPHKNALYISTTEFDSASNSIIAVAHSTNGGKSWTNVQVDQVNFPAVDQFTDLAIGSDGEVYLSWMRCSATGTNGNCGGTKAAMMFSKSGDAGVSWSKPVVIGHALLAPDPCGAFYGCLPNTSERVSDIPVIDVDRSGGTFQNHIYAAYYSYNGTTMKVRVASSADGGATWSKAVAVAPSAPGDEFLPWLTTSANGTVGVTWLDRRRDPSNINYDSFATTSTTGGASFTGTMRLSKVSSNPFNDGFSGSFMGDYTGNSWSGTTLFASWMDTRSGVSQDEVGGLKL